VAAPQYTKQSCRSRPTWANFELPVPPLRLALGQIAIATTDLLLVSAVLHQMLAATSDIDFLPVAAAYVTANSAGILSHVPGGLGVIEAVLLSGSMWLARWWLSARSPVWHRRPGVRRAGDRAPASPQCTRVPDVPPEVTRAAMSEPLGAQTSTGRDHLAHAAPGGVRAGRSGQDGRTGPLPAQDR
jgi:hypothetical protein